MSLGTQLIRAAIEEDKAMLLSRLDDTFFVQGEKAVASFVRAHHRQYGSLPSLDTLRANGHNLGGAPHAPTEPASYYEDKVRRRFVFNSISSCLSDLADAMGDRDTDLAVDTLKSVLGEVGQAGIHHTATLLSDEVDAAVADYRLTRANPGLKGITFGYKTLDDATLGAQSGDLIVVAGRPSQGKTYLALNFAYAAWRRGHRVLFTSMEMSKMQIVQRILGIASGMNPHYIRGGKLSSLIGEPALRDAVQAIKEGQGRMHLEAGDFGGKVSGIDEMVQQYQPEILYVDAAYLLSPEGVSKGYVSRWESIATVVQQLKRMAIRYEIPVVITVQFNKARQKDVSKVAMDTSDIAGSDSIPQDASIIFGMQRPQPPFTDVRRNVVCMKDREGSLPRMTINFRFDPVDFSEVADAQGGPGQEELMHHDENWSL